MLNFYFFCNIFCILGVNLSQKWTKSVHSKTKFFLKNSNFSKDCWSSVFISINTTSAQKLHQNWTIFGGVRIKKHSQNELDIDADLVRKTSKICNLTTLTAILMKLSLIIYLLKSFTWQKFVAEFIWHQRTLTWKKQFFFIFWDEVKKQWHTWCINFYWITG